MRPVAVLRPEPGNAATAARAEALGLSVIRLPLFAVRAVDWTCPDPADHDALILTSANAVRHGGPALTVLRALPVFAVGAATAAAAREAGFAVDATGTEDAAALIALAETRRIAALSDAVRHAAGTGWEAIAVAALPTEAALLAAARSLVD